jgi:hypothetical protein
MKRTIFALATLIALTLSGKAVAQYSGDGPIFFDNGVYQHHASTHAEGYLRGWGDVIRSWGQRNYLDSKALINLEEARSRHIENRVKSTAAYFEMRSINRSARAAEAGPRVTGEQATRYASMGVPKRASAHEVDPNTGEINWPELLQADEFATYRAYLDSLFAARQRGESNGGEIQTTSKQMLTVLKKQAGSVDTGSYIAAKRFIESLAYEARFTPQP